MARERVDSFTEAKELYREHRRERHRAHLTDLTVGATPQFGATGTNVDGVATDFAALAAAEHKLADLHDDLERQLREAAELSEPLGDGSSPVTGPMRKAFMHRVDIDGGVQGALWDYMQELIAVRIAILKTLDTYRGVDGDTVARLQQQMARMEGEGE
ncbi:MAG: hypothetical protein GEV28_12030 [Actinophytocola sp.]|uniref:hypothetical protein n=1 Tax=Actinophytocola sp. TaxID=1872138 RepID=UPI00132A1D27|nr:hypothetical protein [Actinophytocola sp.]MPZ81070.1 hypothetical protein [Actinophytocola sp.]